MPLNNQTRNQAPSLFTRRASAMPKTINEAKRTVDLCWTTGAEVQRMDWWTGTRYIEELVVSEKACDLSRLNAGASLLDTHEDFSLRSILGVVERSWIDGGKGYATVRFSDRDEVEPVWRDVQAGIVRNVSVGYKVRKVEVVKDATGKAADRWRVIDWEPVELSLVPVPADAGAQVRSIDPIHEIEFVEPETEQQRSEADPVPASAFNTVPLWREWLSIQKGASV
jgi:hypothetical protein